MQNLPKTTDTNSTKDSGTGSTQEHRRCQFCGQIADLIWVHGHGQCAACGINAEECCRGERCEF